MSSYIQGYDGAAKRNALAESDIVAFPHEEVFNRLDGATKLLGDLPASVREQVAQAVGELNKLLVADALTKSRPDIFIGRTYLLLNWILNPNAFTGDAISLGKIARLLGMTPSNLSPISSELSRRFGICNRFQGTHNWRNHNHIKPKFEPLQDDLSEEEHADSENGEVENETG